MSGELQDASGQSQPPFSLNWSHYVFLIGLKEETRNFYEIEAAQQGWTLRELKCQLDAGHPLIATFPSFIRHARQFIDKPGAKLLRRSRMRRLNFQR